MPLTWAADQSGLGGTPFQLLVSGTVVLAATDHGVYWLDTAGSDSWTVGTGTHNKTIYAIAAMGGNLWAVDNLGNYWESTNNGVAWTKIGYIDPVNKYTLQKLASTSNYLLAGSYGGADIYGSSGVAWTDLGKTISGNAPLINFIGSVGTSFFFSFVADYPPNYNFRSDNNGVSWAAKNSGISANALIEGILFDATDSIVFIAADSGVYYSTNNGDTWSLLGSAPPYAPLSIALIGTSFNGGLLVIGTSDPGFAEHVIYTAPLTISSGIPSIGAWTLNNGGMAAGDYQVISLAVIGTKIFAISNNRVLYSATYSNPVPAPPTGLTATRDIADVNLTWNPSSGATSYNVYRDGIEIATDVLTVNYDDTTSDPTVQYTYTVTAVNSGGESSSSSSGGAAPITAPPSGVLSSDDGAGGLKWNDTHGTGRAGLVLNLKGIRQ